MKQAPRLILRGHALNEIYCYDTVSNKTYVACACGWSGQFRSNQRAREAHRDHKVDIVAKAAEGRQG